MSLSVKHLGKVALAIVAALVTLSMLEAVTRLTHLAPDVIPIVVSSDDGMCIRSVNHFLSFEMKPNYRNEHSDCKADFPIINSHGLRDIERNVEKPAGVRRIVLLGDSVVVGFGVRRIDDLMSRELERLCGADSTEVLNVAVTGYCTRAEVELLRVKGLRYNPDHVVLMFVENDFDNFNRQLRGIGGVPERPALADFMYNRVHLFRLASLRLNWFGYGVETDPLRWNHRAVGDNNVVQGFQVLKELADQHGFGVTIAIWPSFANDAIVDKDKMHMPDGSGDLIVERLARVHGFPVCRMSARFREIWQSTHPGKNPQLLYTTGDEMHPSVAGHRVAASILKETLQHNQIARAATSRETTKALDAVAKAAKKLGDEKPNYALDHMERAKKLLGEGKTDEALATYQAVLQINRKYAVNAYADMGLILAGQGKFDQAIHHYRESLAHKADFHIAHARLADALAALQQPRQAMDHYRQALRARPEYGPAHARLGAILRSLGQQDEAIEHLGRAARLAPRDATAHKELGKALADARRWEEAIQAFAQAVALQGDDGESHFRLGKAYGALEKLAPSLTHLRRAQQLAPEKASVRNSTGVTLMKLGRTGEAIDEFAEAVRLDPGFELARRNLQKAKTATRQAH